MKIPLRIFAFHHVCNHFLPSVGRVSPQKFDYFLSQIAKRKISTLQLKDVPNLLMKKGRVPCAVLTFDDGLRCFFEHAFPLLTDRGMEATVFIPTFHVGKRASWDYYSYPGACRHLDWGELREIAKAGIEIGCHGHRHVSLAWLSLEEIKRELDYSKKLLEDNVGIGVVSISYPFGQWNTRVARAAREAGFEVAVAMTAKKECHRGSRLLTLPRYGVYLFDGKRSLKSLLEFESAKKKRQWLQNMVSFLASGTLWLQWLRGYYGENYIEKTSKK